MLPVSRARAGRETENIRKIALRIPSGDQPPYEVPVVAVEDIRHGGLDIGARAVNAIGQTGDAGAVMRGHVHGLIPNLDKRTIAFFRKRILDRINHAGLLLMHGAARVRNADAIGEMAVDVRPVALLRMPMPIEQFPVLARKFSHRAGRARLKNRSGEPTTGWDDQDRIR